MKAARPIDKNPLPARVLSTFFQQFMVWWNNLQPEWRRSPVVPYQLPLSQDAPPGETWTSLSHGGRNGIELILFCLCWLAEMVPRPDGLPNLLKDVEWVLSEMCERPNELGTSSAPVATQPRKSPRNRQGP